MRFCTKCGAQLNDEARFCTACGAEQAPAAPETPAQSQTESAPEPQAVPAQEQQPETAAQQSYSPPQQQSYSPPQQQSYVPPRQQEYSQPSQQEYVPTGYASPNYVQPGGPEKPTKKKGGKTALIIIGAVVLVAILAVVLILVIGKSGDGKFVGFWECTAIDDGTGTGKTDNYLGTETSDMFQIDIKKDGKFEMLSFDEQISGTWTASGDTITLDVDGDTAEAEIQGKELVLDLDGIVLYFEKTEGSIAESSASASPAASAQASPSTASETAEAGYLGEDKEYYIEFVGAEQFTDYDGNTAIRVYYNFTQNTETSTSAWMSLEYKAYQNAGDLETTYAAAGEDVPVYGNDNLYIRPGTTIQCMLEYKYDPTAGNVTVEIGDWYGEGTNSVKATFDPANLPGPPAGFTITPVANPTGTQGMADNGALGDYTVAIKDCEYITDDYGNPAVRVYIDFTNNSTDAESFGYALYYYMYQDNVSLPAATVYNSATDSDNALYTDVAPGATVTVSIAYSLRTSDPIEFEINDLWSEQAVGKLFPAS